MYGFEAPPCWSSYNGGLQQSTTSKCTSPPPNTALTSRTNRLHTTTIVEKCTLKLVDDYKHMLCQATEPMSTFLEYIR
ncbi:hypothetical protein HID58_081837 [Brassica napus]|uniref:Uncharacterized protein n=1 Tax=Brassica napus TaxID=3708 RepID=A0ABQ7YBQ4_BRANA|nr:hypothetical protein HID58_081837 [Brassica napus]